MREPEGSAAPEFVIGQMRIRTTRPFHYFCVGTETTRAEADTALDGLMVELDAAVAREGIAKAASVVLVCRFADEGLHLEAGYPVKPGMAPERCPGVRTVDGRRCASLLYWGSLEHYPKAHAVLMQGIRQAGLTYGDELREWYLHFEGDNSPNNVILLQYVLA